MSSNRYSALNRRPAATSSLFQDYPGNTSRPSSSTSQTRPTSYGANTNTNGYSISPRPSSPYGTSNSSSSPYNAVNAYGHTNGTHSPYSATDRKHTPPLPSDAFHHATPNSKGQYSASVLESLESQNDNEQTSILSQKVSQLKSLTIAIGDEIRDSSALAGQINDSFENTSVRLKGTFKRMLRMAEKTGVGWRVWLLFFLAVWAIFAYVWLF